jgi:hypothetical protein
MLSSCFDDHLAGHFPSMEYPHNGEFEFKLHAPLREYLMDKRGEVEDRYSLWRISSILKSIIEASRLYDRKNPVITMADRALERAMKVRVWHENQLEEFILRQMSPVAGVYDPLLDYDGCIPSPTSCMATTSSATGVVFQPFDDLSCYDSDILIAPPESGVDVFKDEGSRFQPKMKFYDVLRQVPEFPYENILLSYTEICTLLSKYIITNKENFFDPRNNLICIVDGDDLGEAWGLRAFHRCQVTQLIQSNITYIGKYIPPEGY